MPYPDSTRRDAPRLSFEPPIHITNPATYTRFYFQSLECSLRNDHIHHHKASTSSGPGAQAEPHWSTRLKPTSADFRLLPLSCTRSRAPCRGSVAPPAPVTAGDTAAAASPPTTSAPRPRGRQWRGMRDRTAGPLVVLCEAGVGWLTDDGARLMPPSREEWFRPHELFCQVLKEARLGYVVLPRSVGSTEERMAFLLRSWWNHIPEK